MERQKIQESSIKNSVEINAITLLSNNGLSVWSFDKNKYWPTKQKSQELRSTFIRMV